MCSCRQVEGKVVEIARLQEIIADKVLEQVILFSPCLPVVEVRQANSNITAWLVAYCCYFLPSLSAADRRSPPPTLSSSSALLRSIVRPSSHLWFSSLSATFLYLCLRSPWQPPIVHSPAHFIRFFILLLSTLFTPAVLFIQLLSQSHSLCRCCSVRAIVSTPHVVTYYSNYCYQIVL